MKYSINRLVSLLSISLLLTYFHNHQSTTRLFLPFKRFSLPLLIFNRWQYDSPRPLPYIRLPFLHRCRGNGEGGVHLGGGGHLSTKNHTHTHRQLHTHTHTHRQLHIHKQYNGILGSSDHIYLLQLRTNIKPFYSIYIFFFKK